MLIDPAELEREEFEAYLAQVRFELDERLRQRLVEWSRPFGRGFHMAVFSAVNGKWDDVRNDLRAGRITLEQANLLVGEFFRFKLINRTQAAWYKEQFVQIARRK